MNHYINTNFTQVMLIWSFVLILLALFGLFLTGKLAKKFSDRASTVLTVILVLTMGALIVISTISFFNRYDYGQIKRLYIVNTENGPRLTVLSFRQLRYRSGTVLTPRLTSFNLYDGLSYASVYPTKKRAAQEYRIFGPFGQKAWGYSYVKGIQLLNLAAPKVLAGKKDILAKNPQLGRDFHLVSSNFFYDPSTQSIQIVTKTGQYFRIGSDLSAAPINNYVLRSAASAGREISLSDLSDYEKEKVVTTIFVNQEKFVFLSRGGYTLSALRKDPVTGKTLERIEYLK